LKEGQCCDENVPEKTGSALERKEERRWREELVTVKD
jgi:hypothetical protein